MRVSRSHVCLCVEATCASVSISRGLYMFNIPRLSVFTIRLCYAVTHTVVINSIRHPGFPNHCHNHENQLKPEVAWQNPRSPLLLINNKTGYHSCSACSLSHIFLYFTCQIMTSCLIVAHKNNKRASASVPCSRPAVIKCACYNMTLILTKPTYSKCCLLITAFDHTDI